MSETTSSSPRKGAHHALIAGFLGWTLDAFDFFVIVFLYDTLAHEFHNRPSTHASPYRAVIGYGDRIAIAAGSFHALEG